MLSRGMNFTTGTNWFDIAGHFLSYARGIKIEILIA